MTLLDSLDDDLKRAVGNVRDASKRLWAVPVHEYYTDHTVCHSDRVVKYLDGLTSAHRTGNKNDRLSNHEIYILLAAAYLHDIGMQFTRVEGNLEQLREVHNEVSYDMILHSINGSEEYPAMGLVKDPTLALCVAEVARSHRRISIRDQCSSSCIVRGDTIRPQFLGALLRLADALDIDRRRVIWERLMLADIPVKSLYHWYRCYYVDGVEVRDQGIRVAYRFPHGTKYQELLVPIIQADIDTTIQEVRDILYAYGTTPVLLQGRIDYSEIHDKMPPDVFSVLWQEYEQFQKKSHLRTSESLPLQGLAREVQFWLEVLGYVIEDWRRCDESSIDLVARNQHGLDSQPIHVRCCDGEIQVNHLQTFESELDSHSISQGWIVSERRVASSAETYALHRHKVKVLTLPRLINRIFAPYYDYLNELTKGFGIDRYYVELACQVPSFDGTGNITRFDSYPNLDKYVDDWFQENGQAQLSILGDYGTGKTWFCRHFAWYLIEIFKADPANNRLPLLIRLRDYASFNSIRALITDFVVNKCKIALPNPYEVFQRLNEDGRLLLLFDGFDEMGTEVDDGITKHHFHELSKAVTKGSKVIFTCRKEYFHSETQAVQLLAGKMEALGDVNQSNFDLLYIKELSDKQIKQILRKRVSSLWGAYWRTIRNVYDLPDLVKRPIMLDMVITAYDDLKDRKSINYAVLYQVCTDQWIERDIAENRTLLDAQSKRFFAQEVAWEMFSKRELTIPFEHIRDLVSRYLDSSLKNQGNIEFLEHDIRAASFISKRDARGHYEFVHKSFMEFFAAQKLAGAIRQRDPRPLKQREVYYEVIRFLYYMIDSERDVPTLVKWLVDKRKPEKLRANGIRISGQWVREDVLGNLLALAEDRQEKPPLRRDAIRSIIRMLHGEEVDWIHDEDITNSVFAYAIRTDRATLDVKLLPIEVKLVRTQAISGERLRLSRKYTARLATLLENCLSEDQPDHVRQNASYALIHFVKKRSLRALKKCALTDKNPMVRFNCCVALIVGGNALGRNLLHTLISSSEDGEIIRLGKTNLERLDCSIST